MRNRLAIAVIYAEAYTRLAAKHTVNAAQAAAQSAQDHKSELACIGGTAVVVGIAARANGFQAGYEFAGGSVTL